MVTTETCVHHWLIETANGPTSLGVCRYCGETRHFENAIFNSTFNTKPMRKRVVAPGRD